MNDILEFLAARERGPNGRVQHPLGWLASVYLRAAVIVVLSYSVFPHLA